MMVVTSNSVLMPIGAIFTTLLVTTIIGLKKFCEEIKTTDKPSYTHF